MTSPAEETLPIRVAKVVMGGGDHSDDRSHIHHVSLIMIDGLFQ